MRVSKLITAALALCLLAGSAQAAFTVAWQRVDPTAAAIAADANLANMQSWTLFVTTDGDWLSAGLNAVLPAGSTFYRAPGAAPIIWNEFGSASQQFSTSVTAPPDSFGDRAPNALGGYPTGSASNGSSSSASPGTFSVSWGDLVDTGANASPTMIGRLTWPSNVAPPTITQYNVNTNPNGSRTSANPGNATIPIPPIPEPASLGLLALVGAFGLRRRSA